MNKIYGIKNCGSVKKALEWFVARDLPFEFHDFRKEGIDPVLLDEWIAKTSCDAVSSPHLRAHATKANLVSRLLLEKKNHHIPLYSCHSFS